MNKILCILVGFSMASNAQTLTLEQCYNLAEKKHPTASLLGLIDAKTSLENENIKTDLWPKIDINAQATYQSEVAQFPLSLPNVAVEPLNKDQYRATLDITQLVYNGGQTESAIALKSAQSATQKQSVVVTLYQLKAKINQYYFTILLLQEKKALLVTKQELLTAKIKEVRSGVKNGALLPASEQVLEAELLSVGQQMDEVDFEKRKMMLNLENLTQTAIAESTIFTEISSYTPIKRPEYEYFQSKLNELETAKAITLKSRLPRISAFGQLGYGNPGLNMLKNDFTGYYITGVRLNWNVFDWNKSKKNIQVLKVSDAMIANEKEVFELNRKIQMEEALTEIEKLTNQTAKDNQILVLREKILTSADAQMRNGVITSADYLTELTRLFEAKINRKTHEIQKQLAEANYKIIKGE